ncbi:MULTISPECIES: D-proline reductase (dithiol) proprotein PrdA [Bifidobacterium]|jgi:D-proline reductase (dithiol) PrdA|uniref:D-proline reductase (dithiol) proprotein PrdA n=1 Tax=Bifidobacterium TaxID=1678 RepID=UPI002355B354|nr:D-proline reductase (dithiol) proprotein PrdA [Bifidobacterium tibiigranuli]MCI1211831.1 D-proline reductase (dithiol) proprotein PrdA [Bifidobacterium tibiigranuli]MCI1221663.1 D-proline reductase (dithiol) proprotein PrdA [Bifidobacterium tibiigranuli]
MSLSLNELEVHMADPAVLCCRRPAGTVLSAQDFEDPTIFDDMVESNLMTLNDDGLTIGQALGGTLKSDGEALTQLTADLVEGGAAEVEPETEAGAAGVSAAATPVVPATPAAPSAPLSIPADAATAAPSGYVHLHLDKAEGLDLVFPAGPAGLGLPANLAPAAAAEPDTEPEPAPEERVMRTLVKKDYPVSSVVIGQTTSYADGVLSIDSALVEAAEQADPLVKKVTMDVIPPEDRHVYSNTIMDVIPIAAKAEGSLGEGVTNVLSGAVFVLTGMDEAGVQIHEFGSCEGFLDEKIRYGRPGCPDEGDIMIRVDVQIEQGTGMERRGPFAAHSACDAIVHAIREQIKDLSAQTPVAQETFKDVRRKDRPRVVLVKEIMGQGAMHDNLLVPTEPCGVQGGEKNVDMGNVPVVLSPNEVLDGGIHALACIGPATKEITRHFFREPLVEALQADEEVDLTGVVFIGSPQVNDEKSFVSGRLGSLIEAMEVDGAIITTEGFGNNHIDFSENIAAIGSRGVPVVGVTFAAYQGQLVVGNKYMDAMIELNKDPGGFENEILADNTLTEDDAERAILMLKTKMAGIPIAAPERKWDESVIEANQALV